MRARFTRGRAVVSFLLLLVVSAAAGGDPWADQVVSFSQGVGGEPIYADPAAVLGSPERFTGELGGFPAAVTPFNGPWDAGEIVSLGEGGHLTVRFAEPIRDDAAHPFGVDFIIFGNGSFIDSNWPQGIVGGLFAEGPFTVSVSADGQNFVPLAGEFSDALFPTLGYLDLGDPYATQPGAVPSDFTRPVNPALTLEDFLDKSFSEIVALYDGAGGGIPFDLAGSGLAEISYIRIDVPAGASSPEIDAFAAVPEPSAAWLFFLSLCSFSLWRGLRLRCSAPARRSMLRRAAPAPAQHNTRYFAAALLIMPAGALLCPAQTWTHHAGDSTRQSSAVTAALELDDIAWIAPPGPDRAFVAHSSPVVYGGRVFVNARRLENNMAVENLLVAYDSHTGEEDWARPLDPDSLDSFSSPAVDVRHGLVLLGAGRRLHALNMEDGSVAWRTTLSRPIVDASPAVATDLMNGGQPANRVFLTDYSGFAAGGALYAINLDPFHPIANPFQPGAIAWRVTLGGASGNSPAYADGVVYVASAAGEIAALNALDGGVCWWFDLPAAGYGHFGDFFGGVTVVNGAVYAATYDFSGGQNNSGLVKLDAQTGQLIWAVPCERTQSIPVVCDDGLILLAGGLDGFGSAVKVQAFDDFGASAALIWDTYTAPGGPISLGGWTFQPARHERVLFVGRPSTSVFFGPYAELYILDLDRLPGQPGFILDQSLLGGGNPAIAGGWIYSIGSQGLTAFRQTLRGDVNCDGLTDNEDIDAFVLALTSAAVYHQIYPDCDRLRADINGDGEVDNEDVDPFVMLLRASGSHG